MRGCFFCDRKKLWISYHNKVLRARMRTCANGIMSGLPTALKRRDSQVKLIVLYGLY